MYRCVVLLDFTHQGITKVNDTVARAGEFAANAAKVGVTVRDQYWTSGSHDGLLVLESANESAVSALLIKLAMEGNVRTQTLRAFDRNEMQAIVGKPK